MMLAQADTAEDTRTGLLRIFDYLKDLNFPSRVEFVAELEAMGELQAACLVLAGIVFLVYGFKYFKALVIINAAGIGALCGIFVGRLTDSQNMPVLLGLAGAVLLGALAWPVMKYCVFLMGALAGGVIGLGLWHFIGTAVGNEGMLKYAWTGGLVGMVAVGMMAFVLFRSAVMIFTAVQGAGMIVTGVCALLLAHPGLRESVRPDLVGNDYLLNLLIGIPSVLGFAYQHAEEFAKINKKRKDTEKPPV